MIVRMPFVLFGPGPARQPIDSLDDERARESSGPAVIFSTSEATPAVDSSSFPEAGPEGERPLAYHEAGGDWVKLGLEAADHWVQMGPELRSRLVEDHLATLDVAEFKQATNGASASMITNNWVHSGSPRVYRVAGQLREFVTVLGELIRV
jgi:hypothetical protein